MARFDFLQDVALVLGLRDRGDGWMIFRITVTACE
jgi:hypothetical protein